MHSLIVTVRRKGVTIGDSSLEDPDLLIFCCDSCELPSFLKGDGEYWLFRLKTCSQKYSPFGVSMVTKVDRQGFTVLERTTARFLHNSCVYSDVYAVRRRKDR